MMVQGTVLILMKAQVATHRVMDVQIIMHLGVVAMIQLILILWPCVVSAVVVKVMLLRQHVKTKVYGIVAMANVFQHHMYVMDQVIPVMQVGVLTVQMVQMKV